MNEALDKFESDERIGHIHGFCYPIDNLPDAFLIKWVGSWGWAIWKGRGNYLMQMGICY